MANSNSFLGPYGIISVAQQNKFQWDIFLFYHEIVHCVFSLESFHRELIRTSTYHYCREDKKNKNKKKKQKKNISYHHLLPGQAAGLTLSGSNYPRLE